MAFWTNGRCDSDEALEFLLRHEIRAPAERTHDDTPRRLPEQEVECMPLPSSAGKAAAGCFVGCQAGTLLGLGLIVTGLCALGGGAVGYVASARSERRRAQIEEDEEDAEQERQARARGLDADVIQSNSVEQKYKAPQPAASKDAENEELDNNQCMVCLETFAEGDQLRQLPCLHRFHCQCIDTWLQRSCQCPICKRDITDDTPPPPRQAPPPQRNQQAASAGTQSREQENRRGFEQWRQAAHAVRDNVGKERSAVEQWIAANTKQVRRAVRQRI